MASFYYSEGVYTKAATIENDELDFSKPQMFKQPKGFFKVHDPTPIRVGENKVMVPKRGFFKSH
jgi:hypothetical protein